MMKTYINGAGLRTLRKDMGLSQAKLSKITGINQARLSAYELGKKELAKGDHSLIDNAINHLDKDAIRKLKVKLYRKYMRPGNIIASRRRRSYSVTQGNKNYLETLGILEAKSMNEKYDSKALSIFAGCGGLCYGMRAAGFKIVGASEIYEGFRKIYAMNFPEVPHLTNDVRMFSDEVCRNVLDREGKIDLMIGGPPCQGFSLTGKRDAKDARNTLFYDYLRIANIIRPKVILMENVRLLTSMRDTDGHLVSERILFEFSKIGYVSAFFCINAKDYGVPQHRERVIFVALEKRHVGKRPSIPLPSHAESADIFGTVRPYITFGDAVSDLEYLESGEKSEKDKFHASVAHPEHVIEWLVDVPEGCSAHENSDPKKRPPSGYNTTYKRQIWNAPGSTVSTTFAMISGCRNIHPIATRSITVREALRLQSFPDSFRLEGKIGDIRSSIGNAVPPLLAYALGKHMMRSYIL